jgi:hypothetical protein
VAAVHMCQQRMQRTLDGDSRFASMYAHQFLMEYGFRATSSSWVKSSARSSASEMPSMVQKTGHQGTGKSAGA